MGIGCISRKGRMETYRGASSLIVDGVKMPHNCHECDSYGINDLVGLECPGKSSDGCSFVNRPEGCPLREERHDKGRNKLRETFFPSETQIKEWNAKAFKVFKDVAKSEGCATCSHCIHVIDYPGFVTGEECECSVGLECDTVLFKVNHCPKYEEREWRE